MFRLIPRTSKYPPEKTQNTEPRKDESFRYADRFIRLASWPSRCDPDSPWCASCLPRHSLSLLSALQSRRRLCQPWMVSTPTSNDSATLCVCSLLDKAVKRQCFQDFRRSPWIITYHHSDASNVDENRTVLGLWCQCALWFFDFCQQVFLFYLINSPAMFIYVKNKMSCAVGAKCGYPGVWI